MSHSDRWHRDRTGGDLLKRNNKLRALIKPPPPSKLDKLRISKLVNTIRYERWNFGVREVGPDRLAINAFRADPAAPKTIQWLGPWPVAVDASPEDVEAICLAAVVEVDGEAAREKFRFKRVAD